jgi:glycosyltransferase involved in cell wall biosynthesis
VILLGVISLVLLSYYLLLFTRFVIHKPPKRNHYEQQAVSIILSSRNEAHHLIQNLPFILNQSYAQFEVIVVNDHSTDETEDVVKDFIVKYPYLKLVNLTSSITNIQGKKFPLSIGIKSAKYNCLLLTDADCTPNSPYWLLNMAKHFQSKIAIVLGYSTYEKNHTLNNGLMRYDNFQTALQYFSAALAKIPYMGIGKNLAYTKTLFYERKGFASHNHINYGDDDLFINKAATNQNVDIEYIEEAHTLAKYKSGFKNWLKDKKHHLDTKHWFKYQDRFLLDIFAYSSVLFYLSLVFAIFMTVQHFVLLTIALGIIFIKILVQYIIYGLSASKLNEKGLIPYILFFDLLLAILYPFIQFVSLLSYKKK